jgi:ribonuclease HII
VAKKIILPESLEDKQLIDQGFLVAGVDEVGRGCLAGPVCAVAVIFKDLDFDNPGITDSKKISENKRIELAEFIKENALDYAVAMVDNNEIDRINILQASQLAMHMAIDQLTQQPTYLLIDGNYFREETLPYQTLVKGDSKSISIAAASILAKVHRDNWMKEVAEKEFPGYGFARHKGYATKVHFAAIQELGECKIHRQSFLRKFHQREMTLFD